MKKEVNTKFYYFSQNNSGGSFDVSEADGICESVIIEALNADDANSRAETIGIYFDGVENEMDCPCCGDRWYAVSEGDGTDTPCIYGHPVEEYSKSFFRKYAFVHYLDKPFEKVEFKD